MSRCRPDRDGPDFFSPAPRPPAALRLFPSGRAGPLRRASDGTPRAAARCPRESAARAWPGGHRQGVARITPFRKHRLDVMGSPISLIVVLNDRPALAPAAAASARSTWASLAPRTDWRAVRSPASSTRRGEPTGNRALELQLGAGRAWRARHGRGAWQPGFDTHVGMDPISHFPRSPAGSLGARRKQRCRRAPRSVGLRWSWSSVRASCPGGSVCKTCWASGCSARAGARRPSSGWWKVKKRTCVACAAVRRPDRR